MTEEATKIAEMEKVSVAPPTTPEQTESVEKAAESTEEVTESLPAVEGETDTEVEGEVDPDAPVNVTITEDELFETEKAQQDRVQKRIDKVIAERNIARDKATNLEERLDSLEKANKSVEEEGKPKWSHEQLNTAKRKALSESDLELYDEVMQHEIAWARYEAEQKAYAPQKKFLKLQADANQNWDDFVAHYPHEDDSDLDISNPQSLVRKTMDKMMRSDPQYYSFDKLGRNTFTEPAQKAVNLILQARYNKVTNRKTKELTRDLAKEKLKTALGSGVSSKAAKLSGSPKKQTGQTRLDEFLAERNDQTEQTKAWAKPQAQ